MALFSGKIEPISAVPDEELSSFEQIHLSVFLRALSKKPTYKAYRALLTHRRTLQCLKKTVDTMVDEADGAVGKASENYRKTAQALANSCNSAALPHPPIAGKALQNIIELQKFYHGQRMGVLVECGLERGRVSALLIEVNKRIAKVEQALVKKYGIHTIDDEGNPLVMQNLERVIDVMASVPGIEKSWMTSG